MAIYARYSFITGGRSAVGGATLAFDAGLPQCIRFDDQHNECRLVSPRVVNQYERGLYLD